jgi:hypothetical protein
MADGSFLSYVPKEVFKTVPTVSTLLGLVLAPVGPVQETKPELSPRLLSV